MPQFDVTSFSSQAFWLVICFTLLYLVVKGFIAPKAELILTSRQNALDENAAIGEKFLSQAAKLESEYKLQLQSAVDQAHLAKQEAMHELENILSSSKDKLDEELKILNQQARLEIKTNLDDFHNREKNLEKDALIEYAQMILDQITGVSPDKELLQKIHAQVIK